MSKMKDLMALTALSIFAAASGEDVYSIKPQKRVSSHEWTRKKCKSCKFLDTETRAYCPYRRWASPNHQACNEWKHK